ncbi:hypothetical protein C477_01620 [Haloterrigena salina JCM 13891]|uniref:Uncharacterized protein n=1 Tax=Haloterrigena salina JCM 13891 TaxID=1227488 RepID=M0CKT1_9EURY|nr:hypothetical protein C477_01620 [Haloterrigena salina JCM 13891]
MVGTVLIDDASDRIDAAAQREREPGCARSQDGASIDAINRIGWVTIHSVYYTSLLLIYNNIAYYNRLWGTLKNFSNRPYFRLNDAMYGNR